MRTPYDNALGKFATVFACLAGRELTISGEVESIDEHSLRLHEPRRWVPQPKGPVVAVDRVTTVPMRAVLAVVVQLEGEEEAKAALGEPPVEMLPGQIDRIAPPGMVPSIMRPR